MNISKLIKLGPLGAAEWLEVGSDGYVLAKSESIDSDKLKILKLRKRVKILEDTIKRGVLKSA